MLLSQAAAAERGLTACGGQITNELVRQLLEQGGMYSLDKPIGDMRYVTDTRCPALVSGCFIVVVT